MTTNSNLQDVNISGLSFSDDGDCLTLDIVDMVAPYRESRLVCKDLYAMCFSRGRDEDIPFYAGEVTWQRLDPFSAKNTLRQLRYPILDENGETQVQDQDLWLVHIEGSVVIDAIAADVVLEE